MEFQDTVPSAGLPGSAAGGGASGPVREFYPSWRSTTGTLTIFLVVLAAIPALMLVFVPVSGFPWGRAAALGSLLWLAWLLGRQLVGGRPALRLGPEGISAAILKNRTIAWSEVSDLEPQTVQGNTSITVSLAPHVNEKWWWGSRKKRLAVPLSSIRAKDHGEVTKAAIEAFASYGGTGFMQAVEVRVAELKAVTDFEDRLKQLTPVTWGLYLMVGLNVVVWIANVASGLSAVKPLPGELLAWGANSASSVVQDRQYWRLLTAAFLHGGIMHLAFNMLGLWVAGQQLNRLHGNVNFLLIYFGSALAGSALSLHFSAQQAVSVGASGAVFGVLGALFVTMHQHRGQIPAATSKNALTSQGVFLVYALVQGFGKQGIDNAAHVGGLVAGCVLAWLLVEKIDTGASAARRRSSEAVAVVLSAVMVVGLVVTTPVPAVQHRQLFEFQAVLKRLLPDMQVAENSFRDDVKKVRDKAMTQAQFTAAVEARHLPAYQRVETALASLDIPGTGPEMDNLRDIRRGNTLMVKLLQLQVKSEREHPNEADPAGEAEAKTIGAEIQAINARVGERLKAAKPAPKP